MTSNGVRPGGEAWFVVHPAVSSAFASGLQRGRLYDALELPPTCTDDELRERINRDMATLRSVIARTDEQHAKKARRALLALHRLRSLVEDARWRVEYDFRHGFINAAARIEAAQRGVGLPLEDLRRIWMRVHPNRARRAAALLKSESREKEREAAQLDPFHPALVSNVTDEGKASVERVFDSDPSMVLPPRQPDAVSEWEQVTPRKQLVVTDGAVRWDDVAPLLEVYQARRDGVLEERSLFDEEDDVSTADRLEAVNAVLAAQYPDAAQPHAPLGEGSLADALDDDEDYQEREEEEASPHAPLGSSVFVAQPQRFDPEDETVPSVAAPPGEEESGDAEPVEVTDPAFNRDLVTATVELKAVMVQAESALSAAVAELRRAGRDLQAQRAPAAAAQGTRSRRWGIFFEACGGALLGVCLAVGAISLLLSLGVMQKREAPKPQQATAAPSR